MNESEVYPCPRCSGVNLTKKFALRKNLDTGLAKNAEELCSMLMISINCHS